jgi:membrane protein insertase Oxa1/YidC/SpoIIIJ
MESQQKKQEAREMQEVALQTHEKRFNRMSGCFGTIWQIIFLYLGIRSGRAATDTSYIELIFYWGLSSVPWLISSGYYFGSRSDVDRISDDIWLTSDSNVYFTVKLIKIIIGVCIGIIGAPLILLLNIIKLIKGE